MRQSRSGDLRCVAIRPAARSPDRCGARGGRAPSARPSATSVSSAAAAANVGGSTGLTPKTSAPRNRVASDRGGEADGDADADEREPARQHQPQHVAALRAERDADADLARPLRDAVRHDAVEPDRREQHRDDREPGQQPHDEQPLAPPTLSIERRAASRPRRPAPTDRARAARRAPAPRAPPRRPRADFTTATRYESVNCACGDVHRRRERRRQVVVVHVGDDADDGAPRAASSALPIRTCAPIGLSLPEHGFAVDCEIRMTGCAAAVSASVEAAAGEQRDVHHAQIVRRDAVALDAGIVDRIRLHPSVHVEAPAVAVAAERNLPGQRGARRRRASRAASRARDPGSDDRRRPRRRPSRPARTAATGSATALNPGLACVSATTVRSIRPAPASSTSASTRSATTRIARARDRPPTLPRESTASVCCAPAAAPRHAGTRPKTTLGQRPRSRR